MSGWRVVLTDSEAEHGVQEVCSQPDVHAMNHGGSPTDVFVYDECCNGAVLFECVNERQAKAVAAALTAADVDANGLA